MMRSPPGPRRMQQLLTYCSLSSCPFYLSYHLSFYNMFYQAVPLQDTTNPVKLPPVYYMLVLFSPLILSNTFSHDRVIWSPFFSRTVKVFLICFQKCLTFSTAQSYAANIAQTNTMQLGSDLYYCTSWLLYMFRAPLAPIIRSTTVHAASDTSHTSDNRLPTWPSLNCMYSCAPDDGCKRRPKHVE